MDFSILVPFFSMATLFFLTRYFPSGTNLLMLHAFHLCMFNYVGSLIWRKGKKNAVVAEAVALFFSDYLSYSEIAAADEDHVVEMGVVDRRTVGMADGFVDLPTQAHVKSLLG